MKQRKWSILSPPKMLAFGFSSIIALGTLLLMLPDATQTMEHLSFLDALFTATSATCVTGLIVVDIGSTFSTFGQTVLLLLIQVGGLGFMTIAALFALLLRRKISFRERLVLQEAMSQNTMEGIVRLIKKVLFYSFVVEVGCGLLLGMRWCSQMPFTRAMYYGIWHAVSLFNNAGMHLFQKGDHLNGYINDPLVTIVAIVLIFTGGLGFIVIAEALDYTKNKKISLHAKVVLTTSVSLVLLATFIIFALEVTNPATLGSLDETEKWIYSLFQAITPRSGGATTLDICALRQTTQFFILILMFIGASPGSTGGGIKVTTFAIMIAAVWTIIRGREQVVLFRYRLADDQVLKALTFMWVAMGFIVTFAMLLSMTEKEDFFALLFETTSAFGTVGLSLGVTKNLTMFGKILVCVMMFIGRLGPVTFALALGPGKRKEAYKYPEGKISIG